VNPNRFFNEYDRRNEQFTIQNIDEEQCRKIMQEFYNQKFQPIAKLCSSAQLDTTTDCRSHIQAADKLAKKLFGPRASAIPYKNCPPWFQPIILMPSNAPMPPKHQQAEQAFTAAAQKTGWHRLQFYHGNSEEIWSIM